MSESRPARLPRRITTGDIADPGHLIHATWWWAALDARAATSPQMVEQVKEHSDKEDTLNKLPDWVVSKEHPSSTGHVGKKEESAIVNIAYVRSAIAGIPCRTEDALPAMMTRFNHRQTVWR